MTGRGVDQILPHRSDPRLHETYVKSASRYVDLAELAHGPISRPAAYEYVWGDALGVLAGVRPDVRIVNLETAITTSEDAQPKAIHYRMHPGNTPVLTALGVDCCVLANNHVMDWGRTGLLETLDTLTQAGIQTAGAGRDLATASAPAILEEGPARVLIFAMGAPDCGIPRTWAAGPGRPGVHFLPDLSKGSFEHIARLVGQWKQSGDVVVASIHWGSNWGSYIEDDHRRFAHGLIDWAQIDVVHGHSSHHPRGIEVYRDRLILYGCGELLNDYEGITGHQEFRSDLVLLYFPKLDRRGRLIELTMTPMQIQNFRLVRPSLSDHAWLHERINCECQRFGGGVTARGEHFELEWGAADTPTPPSQCLSAVGRSSRSITSRSSTGSKCL